jgi:hypothetical protein
MFFGGKEIEETPNLGREGYPVAGYSVKSKGAEGHKSRTFATYWKYGANS